MDRRLHLAALLLLAAAAAAPGATNAPAPAAAGLDLPALKRLALRDNPGLQAARERVQAARERVGEAAAAYAPVVRATAGYTRAEDRPDSASSLEQQLRERGVDLSETDTRNNYGVGLSASWVVYDGLLRKFRVMGDRRRYGSEEQVRQDARRVLLQAVAAAYYAAMQSAGSEQIAVQQAEENRQLGEDAVEREKAGKGTGVEVLNFKFRYNSALADVQTAGAGYRLNRLVLGALLGAESGEAPALAYPQDDPPALPPAGGVAALVAEALRNRPDLQSLRELRLAAEADASAARTGFRPTLTVGGAYDLTSYEDYSYSQDDHSASLYAVLGWDLFSGGSTWFGVRQANARAAAAAFDLDEAEQGAERDVRSAEVRLRFAEGLLPLRRSNVELAHRIRDLTRQRYDSGLDTITRMNQVLNDVTAAEDELIASRVNVYLAQENLKAATGAILQDAGEEPSAP